MSTEILRRAAVQIRTENSPGDHVADTLLAVADWLDFAELHGIPDPHEENESCFDCTNERRALATARAYLGESA